MMIIMIMTKNNNNEYDVAAYADDMTDDDE